MHPSAGGPPIVVERLCSFSRAQGCEASVVTTSLYCSDNGSELEVALRERIDATVLPIRSPHFFKRAVDARRVIYEAVRRADVVHLHTLWHPLNTISRKACARHGRKYVMMPHGMLDPYSLAQKRWRKKLYLVATERRNLEGASRLVFTAEKEEKAAKELLPWLRAGEVIPLAADIPPEVSRHDAAKIFATCFPEIASRRCILFLGRIHQKKGLERLIAALPGVIAKHPSILLVVAGDGEPSYVRQIRDRFCSAGLASHVLMTGRIAGPTKWAALACAEIFVLPSKHENFGISIAEAMHMAVPVVITNKVDSWQLVAEAKAGVILDEASIESNLGQCLNMLLDASADTHSMGECGQNFAKKHLTWPRVARDMLEMYHRVLSE
jgi:glycosyltransferase involved in cell wall biosynthesis